jgi:ABC-type transport system involved in multi-copper enzyme maturation permease subunit
MAPCSTPLAFSLPAPIADYLHWWIAGIVVLVGLFLLGWQDLARLRIRRVWAISSVSFAESIRRKVLWVTPLGILGVIAVALLQHPVDQQEAIRQTIKFCLFASGTLVTITAIILACTNLPREIENRVIFTIVTKPTTRLEIVLGKVVGFVRVSGVIVLIMGLFTFVFLEIQNRQLSHQVDERLQSETDAGVRRTLQGYREAGLLSTLSLEQPADFEIYNHYWTGEGPQRINGGEGYAYFVPFEPTREQQALFEAAAEDPPRAQVLVINTVRLERNTPTKEDLSNIEARHLPMEGQTLGPATPGQDNQARPVPQLEVDLRDAERTPLVPASQINGGKLTSAPPKPNSDGTYTIATPLSPENVRAILDSRKFYVATEPQTPSVVYQITTTPTVLLVAQPGQAPVRIDASGNPRFASHPGRYGMQIVGSPKGDGSVADFRFDNVIVHPGQDDRVSVRFRGGIVRSGDYDPNQPWSIVELQVYNRDTKTASEWIPFHPETNRDIPVAVSAEYVKGGNFDVFVRGMDNGQWIGMSPSSVQLVSAAHSFIVNLVKSLLLLWLFSILVVVIAIFTSTFLSWPIAIVLTLVILLGHWGVEQLGDALNPGVGRSVAQDLGFSRDAAKSQVISTSVDSLAKMLTAISTVLPDLSKFPVMDDITRGVSIPPRHLLESLAVLVYYALPMLVLSFLILKNKEVAP